MIKRMISKHRSQKDLPRKNEVERSRTKQRVYAGVREV